MKITYLGTAAAEAWPGTFCNCIPCKEARRLGGKNIRTRSQVIFNDDLLVDFPCDSHFHSLIHNLDLSAVKDLLITHSHSDHFYPQEFILHGGCYSHNMVNEKINIHCTEAVHEYFLRATEKEREEELTKTLVFHIVTPFEKFKVGEYFITPLPSKHMETEQALIYLIEKDNNIFLYGNDSGRFLPEVYDYLKKNNIKIDMVSFDCTGGPIENGETSGHMGFPDELIVREKLENLGICNSNTVYISTHFSHNGGLLHDELCKLIEPKGFIVAYDGMTIYL